MYSATISNEIMNYIISIADVLLGEMPYVLFIGINDKIIKDNIKYT